MSKEITMDDLAMMINNMDQRLSNDIKEIKQDMSGVRADVNDLKGDVRGIKGDIYDLKEGQRRIEDRLSNTAYKFDLKAIEKRVTALES